MPPKKGEIGGLTFFSIFLWWINRQYPNKLNDRRLVQNMSRRNEETYRTNSLVAVDISLEITSEEKGEVINSNERNKPRHEKSTLTNYTFQNNPIKLGGGYFYVIPRQTWTIIQRKDSNLSM